jgi:hypothetical protein
MTVEEYLAWIDSIGQAWTPEEGQLEEGPEFPLPGLPRTPPPFPAGPPSPLMLLIPPSGPCRSHA